MRIPVPGLVHQRMKTEENGAPCPFPLTTFGVLLSHCFPFFGTVLIGKFHFQTNFPMTDRGPGVSR